MSWTHSQIISWCRDRAFDRLIPFMSSSIKNVGYKVLASCVLHLYHPDALIKQRYDTETLFANKLSTNPSQLLQLFSGTISLMDLHTAFVFADSKSQPEGLGDAALAKHVFRFVEKHKEELNGILNDPEMPRELKDRLFSDFPFFGSTSSESTKKKEWFDPTVALFLGMDKDVLEKHGLKRTSIPDHLFRLIAGIAEIKSTYGFRRQHIDKMEYSFGAPISYCSDFSARTYCRPMEAAHHFICRPTFAAHHFTFYGKDIIPENGIELADCVKNHKLPIRVDVYDGSITLINEKSDSCIIELDFMPHNIGFRLGIIERVTPASEEDLKRIEMLRKSQ